MRALLVATILLAAGCSLSTDYSGTSFRCDDGQGCPPGFECVDGTCVMPGTGDPDGGAPDGSTPPDAGAPDAGDPASSRCGTVAMVRDDFEDGVEDPKWSWSWADTGSSKQETGGELVLRTTGGSGEPWAGYMSAYLYDHTDATTAVEVTMSETPWTVLELRSPDGAKLQLMRYLDDLEAVVYIPGNGYATRAEIPFDGTAHRWWRFREAGGTTYWEASPDGQVWTAFHSEANPIDMRAVHVLLAAGGAHATDSEARYASVNADADPAETWCPSATLTDDFDDGARAPVWSWSWDDAGCTVGEAGGQLVMSFDGSADSWCGYYTGRLFRLTDSTVTVEVPLTLDGGTTALLVESGSNRVGMRAEDALITWYAGDGSSGDSTTPYDATAHRWWRLRESGGTLHWETSPDGTTFDTRASVPTPFDLSAVHIELSGGVGSTALDAPADLRFDNLNP